MIELVKNLEIKIILKAIKSVTDVTSYREILLNIGNELLEEQRKNNANLKKDPKKYRVVIKNTERFLNVINEELGVYRNE